MSRITTRHLDCGLALVTEEIASVRSVAVSWMLPVGTAGDPPDGDGQAAMLSELVFRGAGGMSSREHSDALDRCGVQRAGHTLSEHLQITASLLGDRLDAALPLLTALVREPAIPDDAIDPVRSLCLQALASLDDDPQHLAMLRLRAQHLPAPFGRSGYGEAAVLESLTGRELREAWRERCRPRGAILSVAGAVDPARLATALDAQLGGWTGEHPEPVETAPAPRGYRHVEQDTAQVHLAVAWSAPREVDDSSMLERLATTVLSGSTSGRLFTEVRQKRSLCYSVGASYRAGRDRGLVALYAGTTPERAEETLEVCGQEIDRLYGRGDVSPEEHRRALVGLKSHLVMQGESTPARASALGSDHYRLGRARSLDEVARAAEAISLDQLNAYLAERSVGPLTVVSVGPSPLEVPGAGASLPAGAPPR